MAFYAASKHALEGWSESLDHEVRPFGIRACLIEPGFTKTKIGANMASAANPMSDYDDVRRRVFGVIEGQVGKGANPATVAQAIFRAATAARPKLRYAVGGDAKLLSRLRKFAPAGLMDSGVRKEFQLDPAR
jgi:NAD(P)-dependent dehydrogenase (short-subunit alcohol dehydrogenase family)